MKTVYDVQVTTISGDVLILKGVTWSTLVHLNSQPAIADTDIIKTYSKKM